LDEGNHTAVVLRNFLTPDEIFDLNMQLERTQWEPVRTSRGKIRQDIMSCFFAQHETARYTWGHNAFNAQDNALIGKLAARLSRICKLKHKFNVASAMKYMVPNTTLPRHKDTERDDAHEDRKPFIASISIGADADFALYPRNKPAATIQIKSGDLVVFYGDTDHSASTGDMKGNMRYNITYRRFVTPTRQSNTQRTWSLTCSCHKMSEKDKRLEARRPARMRCVCSLHGHDIYEEHNRL